MQAYQFQQDAIDTLVETFKTMWRKPESGLNIILKSPTGSGKTYMTTHFIDALNQQPDWDDDVAFVWITFSDSLAMQSKKKFEEYFFPNVSNTLLTIADINSIDKLSKGDVFFLNWQKVTSRRADDRKVRRPSEGEHKESGNYFEDIFDATHADSRQLVMIIDESHTHTDTELSNEIIQIINPKIILKVSATPFKNEKSKADYGAKVIDKVAALVQVERQAVVDAGLIKEEIITQTDEDLQTHKGKDKDKLMIDLAIAKRNELAEAWKKAGTNINPLVLIQLPNDDNKLKDQNAETKEEVVLKYLKELNISDDRIDMWFDKHELKYKDTIADADCPVDFMLFKQAAGTGWDCPRAQILVMYREIKSAVFHTQTLGRIMRMPFNNADLTAYPALHKGYLYTNYDKNAIQSIPKGDENKLKTEKSELPKQTKIKFAEDQFTNAISKTIVDKITGGNASGKTTEEIDVKKKSFVAKAKEIAKKVSKETESVETSDQDELQKQQAINKIKEEATAEIKTAAEEQFGEDAKQISATDISAEVEKHTDTVRGKIEVDFVLDPYLICDFISRADYGDLGRTRDFQSSFIHSMNVYFGIDELAIMSAESAEKLKAKNIDINPSLEQKIIVNAHFRSETEKQFDNGSDTQYEMSANDATKNFTYYCYELLNGLSKDDNLFGNVARSYPMLKSALRLWFQRYALATYKDIDFYKVFIKDVQKEASSVFALAIKTALDDYRTILAEFKKGKQEKQLQNYPFVIKAKYLYTDDYKEYTQPSTLSVVQPFRLPENYSGRDNETAFIAFLEQQYETLEWWFKNGDSGQDFLGFKYFDTQSNKDRIFYPDWILKFKDGRIGIFDTKGGITAASQETKDKAEALYKRLAELNEKSIYQYVGGIVVKEGGQWLYNDAAEYEYKNGDTSNWKPIQTLFARE